MRGPAASLGLTDRVTGRSLTPHDRYFVPLFAGIVVLAWAALGAWDLSPYAGYLDHDWTRLGLAGSLCGALPAGDVFVSDGYGNRRVVHFDPQGKFVKAWGQYGGGPGEFCLPLAAQRLGSK